MNISYLENKKAFRIFLVIIFMVILFILADATGLRETITIAYIKDLFLEHKLLGSVLFIILFAIGPMRKQNPMFDPIFLNGRCLIQRTGRMFVGYDYSGDFGGNPAQYAN